MTGRALIALAAVLAVSAAACGRAGPPRQPGPREAITYPRLYPAPDPLPAATSAGTTPAATGATTAR